MNATRQDLEGTPGGSTSFEMDQVRNAQSNDHFLVLSYFGGYLQSWVIVALRPRFSGGPGWVRSSAWIWLPSATPG